MSASVRRQQALEIVGCVHHPVRGDERNPTYRSWWACRTLDNGGPVYRTPLGYNQRGFATGFVGNYEMHWAITVTTTDTRMQTNYVSCSRNGVALTWGCSFPH